ncbi:hypothetical protein AAHE18_18G202200 [Arachis hypogaea]
MGFHDTIFEQRWTTPYYIGSDLLKPCIARCHRNFPYHEITRFLCIRKCYDHHGSNKLSSRRGAHVFWLSRILLGGTESKKGRGTTMHGTSRPCLRRTVERATHECCRVG